jgi:hypothetical protein
MIDENFIKRLDELNINLRKEADIADAILTKYGVRVVSYIVCIRCGAKFTTEQFNLCLQHIEMFHRGGIDGT